MVSKKKALRVVLGSLVVRRREAGWSARKLARAVVLMGVLGLAASVVSVRAAASPAVPRAPSAGAGASGVHLLSDEGSSSFVTSLMKSMAEGAAGTVGSDIVGWVLPSAGSTDQDLAVLNQISGQLTTIENTLVGIENEIATLTNAVQQLDCDTWVQTALPDVDAISNLWDPNSVASGNLGAQTPQQSYVGIVNETKDNTITPAEMQTWVDQVLNNNGQGIGGLSVLDYLQDLGNVLIPPAGGTGIIKGCLTVSSNSTNGFLGQTDDAYYNTVVAPLINYYYAIQTEGLVMVVEALNFEAWQASGSPISTPGTISDLPTTICGNPTGQAAQDCQNADWAVLGTDGTSGVRGRVAAQFTLGGAPYTTSSGLLGTQPVHRYIGGSVIYASSPSLFSSVNPQPNETCMALTSADPCGILSGEYNDTTIDGRYGPYGAGAEGVWRAAADSDLYAIAQFTPGFTTAYTNLGDYLMKERGFQDLPDNTIFVTADPVVVEPYGPATYQQVLSNGDLEPPGPLKVVAFTDTGLLPQYFPFMFGNEDPGGYFNISDNSLQVRTGERENCDVFATNSHLPSPEANNGFYIGGDFQSPASSEFCGLPENTIRWEWTGGYPPGWARYPAGALAHPQFRLPVVPLNNLTCSPGVNYVNAANAITMCGDDFQAWLDLQVPPAPEAAITAPTCQRALGNAVDQSGRWHIVLVDHNRDVVADQVQVTRVGVGSSTFTVRSVDWNRSSATILGDGKDGTSLSLSLEDGQYEDRFAAAITRGGKTTASTAGFVTATRSNLQAWQIDQPAGGCPRRNQPKPTGETAGGPSGEGELPPQELPNALPPMNPIPASP